MSRPVDQSSMRRANQRLILETIQQHNPVSRAELARILLMSKPAISDNLNGLLEHGAVEEIETVQHKNISGRKPIPVQINKNYRYILAIDLNYLDPVFALSNFTGEILADLCVKVDPNLTFEKRVELIKNALNLLIGSNNISLKSVLCIGIASPGVFDNKNLLYCISLQFQKWFEGDIISMLSTEYGVPVFVKNDANTAAIGEYYFGTGKETTNLLYLSCGMGFGCGLILNGHLYEGRKFTAGNVTSYTDTAKQHIGETVENVIRIESMLKKICSDLASGVTCCLSGIPPEELCFEHIVKAYQSHDIYIINLLTSIAEEIACIASNIACLLEIETVVLGGEYTVFYDLFHPIISEVFKHGIITTTLKKAALGRHSGLYGLFSIARTFAFDEICQHLNSPQETKYQS